MPITTLHSENFLCDASTKTGVMDLNTGIKLHCNDTVIESEIMYYLLSVIFSDCSTRWDFPSCISFTLSFCSISIPSVCQTL